VKYLLTIGSNVQPASNVRWALSQMLDAFGNIKVGRFFQTPACGMKSSRLFWNGAVLIDIPMEKKDLKVRLCKWEEESGRDRTHPKCSTRDRTLDIDIVWSEQSGWLISHENITNADYLTAPIASLMPICFPHRDRLMPIYFSFRCKLLGVRPVHLK